MTLSGMLASMSVGFTVAAAVIPDNTYASISMLLGAGLLAVCGVAMVLEHFFKED